jgi:endogenous inhibitor of DNA gyrase (YacG/DUF329 family)
MPATVKCPTCATQVEWIPENRFRPFCSERCKNIDLGAWSSESYTIAADMPPDPLEDGDLPTH